MKKNTMTKTVALAIIFSFIFTGVSCAGDPGKPGQSQANGVITTERLTPDSGNTDTITTESLTPDFRTGIVVTNATTAKSTVTFQGNTTEVAGDTLPAIKDRVSALGEFLDEDYQKEMVILTRMVNYGVELTKHTMSVNQDDVFTDMMQPLEDAIEAIKKAQKESPANKIAMDDAIKTAVDQAVKDLEKLVDKQSAKIKALENNQSSMTAQIGNLINGQNLLNDQMPHFWDNQAFVLWVVKDAKAKFGVKVLPAKMVDGAWKLGTEDELPRLVINYNTVESNLTDTKVLNIFGVARTGLRTSDQAGYTRVIISSRGIARNNCRHLFSDMPAAIDGVVGHPVLMSVESDPFMTEKMVHENLDYRGLHKKADRDWLIGNCK